jgi:hypothetical protein
MTLLDQIAGDASSSPDAAGTQPTESLRSPQGSTTVIILDRDGSLRHYPPGRDDDRPRQAQVELKSEEAHQSVIAKILAFTFDILRADSLEVRVNEHPKG